jgi:hypothetical protein
MQNSQELAEAAKHSIDAVSIATAVGTVLGWLPEIAALFTIIWTGIRIYESKTAQTYIIRNSTKGCEHES